MSQVGKFKLCYVDYSNAWFTTQDLKKQWGDDWNDVPYEHNAGSPYGPNRQRGEDWELVAIRFEGSFDYPNSGVSNSSYSVEDINKGAVAWLRTEKWDKQAGALFAGATLQEFIDFVQAHGGKIWAPWLGVSALNLLNSYGVQRLGDAHEPNDCPYLHVKNCPGCGRSCSCYDVVHTSDSLKKTSRS